MPEKEPDYKSMYLKLMYHMVEIEKIAKTAMAECDKNANGRTAPPKMEFCNGKIDK